MTQQVSEGNPHLPLISLTDGESRRLADAYQFTTLSCDHAYKSWGSHKRLIITGDEQKYVLKGKPYYLNLEQWLNHHLIHGLNSSEGAQLVPNIALNKNGETYYELNSGEFVELQAFVNGRELDSRSADDHYQLGVVASKFSKQFRSIVGTNWNWDSPSHRTEFYPLRVGDFGKLFGKIEKAITLSALDSKSFVSHCLRCLTNRVKDNNDFSKLPKGIAHGDLHTRNAKISENGRGVLLDLDDCRKDYLLQDVSWCACVVAAFDWGSGGFPSLRPEWNTNLLRSFGAGYKTTRTLVDVEKYTLDYFMTTSLIAAFSNCLGLDDPVNAPQQLNVQTLVNFTALIDDIPEITKNLI